MANPGTALTSLWNESDVNRGKLSDGDRANASVNTQQDAEIKHFYRDRGLENLALESGLVGNEKTNVVTIDPSSIVALEQVACSGLTNLSAIAVKVTSSGNSNGNSGVQVSGPILLTPSMLIQKQGQTPPSARSQGASTAQKTPTCATPVLPSPSSSWASSSGTPGRKRRTDVLDSLESERKRRRTPNRSTDKGGKGLRHFSMKVCEKVQQKGTTTYNEVADELVREFSDGEKQTAVIADQSYDQKNIRRRVYDALNVLMAMNIITKEKKEIKWVGLPTNSAQECARLEEQKQEVVDRIKQKQQQLQELVLQQVAFKSLVERNKAAEKQNGPPVNNSAIHLPFIIVNTSKKTVIDCSISSDKSEYLFNFDNTFEIHDDIEVLKRMGLTYGLENGNCSDDNVKTASALLPKALEPFVSKMAKGSPESDDADMPSIAGKRSCTSNSPLATPLNSVTASPSQVSSSASPSRPMTRSSRTPSAASCGSHSKKSLRHMYTPSSSFSESCSEHETDEDLSRDGVPDAAAS